MMKRLFATILMLSASVTALWAGEPTDTVIRIGNPECVEVKTEGSTLTVKAKGYRNGEPFSYTYTSAVESASGDDWEVNLPFTKSYWETPKRKHGGCRLSVDWFDNFYVGGLIGLDRPEGMRGGWEIGVDNLVGLFWHTGRRAPVFSLGFGLGYRSTNFGKGMMLAQRDRKLVVVPVDEESASASSRLHLFRLSVPFMITQPLCGGMSVRVGAILNLNTYTSATTKIRSGKRTYKESFHSLEQRFATPDFLGSLILCDNVGIYVRWSPVPLFSSEWGPRYRSLTVGVNFVM